MSASDIETAMATAIDSLSTQVATAIGGALRQAFEAGKAAAELRQQPVDTETNPNSATFALVNTGVSVDEEHYPGGIQELFRDPPAHESGLPGDLAVEIARLMDGTDLEQVVVSVSWQGTY